MKTIGVWNKKGGTGKTTGVGNVAAELRLYGKTLAVDLDPQGNLSGWLVPQPFELEAADVLQGTATVEDAAVTVRDGLDILPTFSMGGSLKNWSQTTLPNQPFAFADFRDKVDAAGYDFLILDFAPADRTLEMFALAIVEQVVIVGLPEYFSVDGYESARSTLDEVKHNLRGQWRDLYLLVNRVNRSYASHDVLAEEFGNLGLPIFTVGQSTSIHDCLPEHKTLNEYDPGNKWSSAYVDLAARIAG